MRCACAALLFEPTWDISLHVKACVKPGLLYRRLQCQGCAGVYHTVLSLLSSSASAAAPELPLSLTPPHCPNLAVPFSSLWW